MRHGRSAVVEFARDEKLYRAVPPETVSYGRLTHHGIDYPSCSVNRGTLSEPADVLIPEKRKDWIPAECEVQSVPTSLISGDGRVFEFRVEHAPEEYNYAHSEIRCYLCGERHERGSPKRVKKMFRMELANRMRVVESVRTQ